MNNIAVVVGSQWGDEGKGKIIDFLGKNFQNVVRYQGGNNAGHTIVFSNQKFALNHIPSGIFSSKISNFIGQGAVINPRKITQEIKELQKRGFDCKNLFIAEGAHVIMPYHIDIDTEIEKLKSTESIGTTKNGIGPCYEDKYGRIGIRMVDFIDKDEFKKKLKFTLNIKNKILTGLGIKNYTVEELFTQYEEFCNFLRPHVINVSYELQSRIAKNESLLFEGAQGVMLCIENGTYPFVTSSSPTSASVGLGSGINFRLINRVIGVTKAYTTRVGSGAFPTEIANLKIRHHIRDRGHEYGTVTGRERRIGWLDMVILNHSYNICGTDEIALTLLDVLDEIDKIKICVSYTYQGKEIQYFPSNVKQLKQIKPNFIELPGWQEDTSSIKNFDELPQNAKNYVRKIEELSGRKVKIISVGPDRTQTFLVK